MKFFKLLAMIILLVLLSGGCLLLFFDFVPGDQPGQTVTPNSPGVTLTQAIPTETPQPGLTGTPEFTPTAKVSPTPTEYIPEETPTPTIPPTPKPPYSLQPGSPNWTTNFAHPEQGCNWLGIAGQVFDVHGDTVDNLLIEAGGTLDGKNVSALVISGLVPVYGPGGYEIVLADHLISSTQTIWIKVKDLAGKDLSDQVFIDTYADCERGLVVINFLSSDFFSNKVFLPIIDHD